MGTLVPIPACRGQLRAALPSAVLSGMSGSSCRALDLRRDCTVVGSLAHGCPGTGLGSWTELVLRDVNAEVIVAGFAGDEYALMTWLVPRPFRRLARLAIMERSGKPFRPYTSVCELGES